VLRMLTLLHVAATLLWALPGCSQGGNRPVSQFALVEALAAGHPVVRIVGFGDSTTGVYYHTGGRRAWPEMLGLALQRLHPQAKIETINAGVSGGNTASGLARMDRDVLAQQPDLVVIMFGMNDVVANTSEAFEANLRTMVAKCRESNSEVLLCTPNWIAPGDDARPLPKLGAYADIVRRLGEELAVPVTDCFSAFEAVAMLDLRESAMLMSDGIHPNMRGGKCRWQMWGRCRGCRMCRRSSRPTSRCASSPCRRMTRSLGRRCRRSTRRRSWRW
jgi:lysophospholipase L1-like esterase